MVASGLGIRLRRAYSWLGVSSTHLCSDALPKAGVPISYAIPDRHWLHTSQWYHTLGFPLRSLSEVRVQYLRADMVLSTVFLIQTSQSLPSVELSQKSSREGGEAEGRAALALSGAAPVYLKLELNKKPITEVRDSSCRVLHETCFRSF